MARTKAQSQRSIAGFIGAKGGLPTVPTNSVSPSITGTAQVGATLTAANGTWAGRETPVLSRQWNAAGVAIPGATAATYVPVTADIGKVITVTVTGKNWAGKLLKTSAATAAVVA